MTAMKVPLVQVQVGEAAKARLEAVVASGRLAQGPVVAELEETFAAASGVPHCVAVSNGTIALQAALIAAGVGPGDEVITTPFSFIATVNAILSVGADVAFVDIADDFTIDPAAVAAAVTDRTRAVLPVHLFGLPADLPAILEAVRGRDIAIIEDAAQAHGAAILDGNGVRRPVGGWGLAGCFSLYATKNLSAGEGGLVTTTDAAFADRLRVLRNQGMRARYDYAGWGSNFRMSDLHAAIVVDDAARLAEINAHRQANAHQLLAGLADIPGLVLPPNPPGRECVWHQFTVRVDGSGPDRDGVAAALASRGIGSDVFYPQALCDVAHIAADPRTRIVSADRARRAAATVLSLPVGHHLDADQLDLVIAAVREVFDA